MNAPPPQKGRPQPICVVQLVLSLAPGGTERLVVELVNRLSGRFRMAVCCLDEAGEWGLELANKGVQIVALDRKPGFHPMLGSRVAAFAAEQGADVLHCHHFTPFVYGRLARLWNRDLHVIYTEHGRLSDQPATRKRRLANRMFGHNAGPMFSVSFDLREYLVREGLPERLAVIHNGISVGERPDPEARSRARRTLRIADGTVIIGTAARLDPVKDLQTLIDAVSRVRAHVPGVALVIVGDGPEREALERTARERGVEDNVIFTGYRSDARELLPGFDIYVNSSISEGISLTILEAMAAGLPVVATRVGGNPEVVLDGQTGVLVPSRSAAALADGILTLASNGELRRSLAAAGRSRVATAFTIERMVDDYAREYERLAGG